MTYREILSQIDNAIKSAQAYTGVGANQVYLGREDMMKLSAPFIGVFAEPLPYKSNEDGTRSGLRKLKITIFCTVLPAASLPESMISAVEMCERVEAVLANHFSSKYTVVTTPTFDAHYADYSCAEFSFTLPYTSSAAG